MTILSRPSPNFDARQRPIDLIVLHYTGMQDLETALARLTDPAPVAGRYPGPWQDPALAPATPLPKVSAHYCVARDGRVFQLVEEEARAWHAGVSLWRGLEGVNHNAIGIEIENGGHDFGLPPYPEEQIAAVCALVEDILARRSLPMSAVVGHSDVALARKHDPGEHFPWATLAAAGLSVWPGPAGPGGADVLISPGESGGHVQALQEALAGIGYGVDVTGDFDSLTIEGLMAFQRRFRPQLINGVVDRECLNMITDIIEQTLRLGLSRPPK